MVTSWLPSSSQPIGRHGSRAGSLSGDSFGNRTHIYYRMGHEMTFVIFVCRLFKVSFLGPKDMVAIGLKVVSAYFDLARYFQTRYRMEAADSMGMCNLEDYQFVTLILRAAQLSQGSRVKPKAIAGPRDGLKVFSAYFDLARYLQTLNRMEPAGSMGMWSLDDYQFVALILFAPVRFFIPSQAPVSRNGLMHTGRHAYFCFC